MQGFFLDRYECILLTLTFILRNSFLLFKRSILILDDAAINIFNFNICLLWSEACYGDGRYVRYNAQQHNILSSNSNYLLINCC